MKNLTQYHWTSGGTGVTNFNHNQRALYQAAVDLFGDENLVLSDVGMHPWPQGASLHDLSDSRRDLSDFWAIFYYLAGRESYHHDVEWNRYEKTYNEYLIRKVAKDFERDFEVLVVEFFAEIEVDEVALLKEEMVEQNLQLCKADDLLDEADELLDEAGEEIVRLTEENAQLKSENAYLKRLLLLLSTS